MIIVVGTGVVIVLIQVVGEEKKSPENMVHSFSKMTQNNRITHGKLPSKK